MLIVRCSCDVFRLLDVGVTNQERRGAPTSALRPGAAPTSSKRHVTNMNTNTHVQVKDIFLGAEW